MKFLQKIRQKIIKNIPEILFVLGLFFINFATFSLNYITGIYVLGATLTGLGIFLARLPTKK